MNNPERILHTVYRKVHQGVSAGDQYAALNEAREKRKRRRERNLKNILAGGWKQIPILDVTKGE